MFKISKLTDYSVVILHGLTHQQSEPLSARQIADALNLSLPTVSKILKILHHAGIVSATRGAQGGYQLAKTADQISMASIITAMEGPTAITECSIHAEQCSHASSCSVRANWQVINNAIETALQSVSLADMMQPLNQHPISQQGISVPIVKEQI